MISRFAIFTLLISGLAASNLDFTSFRTLPLPDGGYDALKSHIAYPDVAFNAGTEGTVVVQAYVDTNGIVTSARIKQGIANTGFNAAALRGVEQMRFDPATQNGRAVGVWVTIPVVFTNALK